MKMATEGLHDFDIELAKMLITATLSLIFFGRRAFPARCFREITMHQIDDPHSTHESLFESGQPLSPKDHSSSSSSLSPDNETLVYARKCNDSRFNSFMADLNQVFDALEHRLVGKIFVCFTPSRKWSIGSLLECYTLKFSYTELGSFHIYIDWAGILTGDTSLKDKVTDDAFKSLKRIVYASQQLPDVFYTHFFVSSVDSQTELEGAWAGRGHGVREALLHLKGQKGTVSGRIGKFNSAPPARDDLSVSYFEAPAANKIQNLQAKFSSVPRNKASRLAASKARPGASVTAVKRLKSLENMTTVRTQQHAESCKTSTENLASVSTVGQPLRRSLRKRTELHEKAALITQEGQKKPKVAPKYGCRLTVIEEVSEDLPSTQRLDTPRQTQQMRKSPYTNPMFISSDSETSSSAPAKRKQKMQAATLRR